MAIIDLDIPLVLGHIRKGAHYGWLGSRVVGQGAGNYDNIDWRDDIQSKPTEQDIIDAWPAVKQEYITDVQDVQVAKTALVSNLRAGLVDSITLQNVIADILEGNL